MAVQPGLSRTWSETPKTGFLITRLILHKLSLGEATVLNHNSLKSSAYRMMDTAGKPSLIQKSYLFMFRDRSHFSKHILDKTLTFNNKVNDRNSVM